MKRWIVGICCLAFLSSCMVTYQPLPEGYSGPTAMIVDTMDSISSTRAGFFQVVEIDGRPVLSSSISTQRASAGQGFDMDQRTESRLVPAGLRKIKIEGVIDVAAPILALSGGMHKIQGVVEVELEPDRAYYVRGALSDQYKAVWLDDNKRRRVSRMIEVGVRPARLEDR